MVVYFKKKDYNSRNVELIAKEHAFHLKEDVFGFFLISCRNIDFAP